MTYWLMKTEPSTFSLEDLASRPNQTEPWDGVRNYQARNMMRDQMAVGDRVFFYHSNCEVPGIVAIAEIVRSGYPDPTAFDPDSHYFDPKSRPEQPTWYLVDVRLVRPLRRTIGLAELKTVPELADFTLLRPGNRLSVMPVDPLHWQHILERE